MEIDHVKARKREVQQRVLTLLEQQEGTVDEHPFNKALRQVLIHVAQAELAYVTEMCLHDLDGRVPLRVFKTAMQRQIQVLCERQLDFECNEALTTLAFRSESGSSYLHLAVDQGDQESVLHLLRAGACVDALNNYRRTPLTYALYTGNVVATGSLLDFGADINHVDDHGNTPLHIACMAECLSEKVVDRLLRTGADERALDRHGLTPLDALMRVGSEKEGFGNVRLLLEKAPARRLWLRRWGWIVIFRNRADAEVVGDGGSDRVEELPLPLRRSSRQKEGKARIYLEFLVRRAPDGVFFKIMSFL